MIELIQGVEAVLKGVNMAQDLIRKGRDLAGAKNELQEQLLELKEQVLALKQEALAQNQINLSLTRRNQELTQRLEAFRAFEFSAKDYTARKVEPGTTVIVRVDDFQRPINEVASYCVKCFAEHEIQPLQFKVRHDKHDAYECHKCGSTFEIDSGRESLSRVAFSKSKFDDAW